MQTPPFPSEIPLPLNEQDFERLCVEVYRLVYDCKRAPVFGRRGQDQSGIDVLLRSPSGLVGLQAKKYAKLTRKVIEKDIEAADASRLSISEFLVVTTARSDRNLVEWVEILSLLRVAAGLCPVAIDFWEDVCAHIRRYPALTKFDVRPPAAADEGGQKRLHDLQVTRSLFSNLNITLLNEHLQSFPYVNRYDVLVMFDRFTGAWQRPSVFIHDVRLRKRFGDFARAWERATPQEGKHFFEDTPIWGIERFQSTGAQYRLKTFQKAPLEFKELQRAIAVMAVSTRKLLDYVQGSFPELNLHEIGLPLGRELNDIMKSMRS